MPKNIKGGKKTKGLKNSDVSTKNREIAIPMQEDDSHIGIITKIQGDSRYLCQIVDSTGLQSTTYPVNLSAGTKNKYSKGIIVGLNTYILFAIREFQKDKGDIIFVYKDSEIPYLIENSLMILINKDETKIIENQIIFTDGDENFDFQTI